MEIPETPRRVAENEVLDDPLPPSAMTFNSRPNLLNTSVNLPVNPYKRRRSQSVDWTYGPTAKHRSRRNLSQGDLSPRSEVKNAVQESDKIVYSPTRGRIEEVVVDAVAQRPSLAARRATSRMLVEGGSWIPSVLRHIPRFGTSSTWSSTSPCMWAGVPSRRRVSPLHWENGLRFVHARPTEKLASRSSSGRWTPRCRTPCSSMNGISPS